MEKRKPTGLANSLNRAAQFSLLLLFLVPVVPILQSLGLLPEAPYLPSSIGIFNTDRTWILAASLLALGLSGLTHSYGWNAPRRSWPWGKLFLGWVLLSAIWSSNPVSSLLFAQSFLAGGLVFYAGRRILSKLPEKTVILLTTCLLSAVCLHALSPFLAGEEASRIAGVFGVSGVLCNWLVIFLPLLLASSLKMPVKHSIGTSLTVALALTTLFATHSRAGWFLGGIVLALTPLLTEGLSSRKVLAWLGFLLACLVTLQSLKGPLGLVVYTLLVLVVFTVPVAVEAAKTRVSKTVLARLLLIVLLSLTTLWSTDKFSGGQILSSAQERITKFSGQDNSVNARAELLKSGLSLVTSYPIIGTGPGNFRDFYPQVQRFYFYYSDSPHSSSLELAIETGLPGLLLLIAFVATVLFQLGKRESLSWFEHSLILGLLAGIAYAQIEVTYQFAYLWVTIALVTALLERVQGPAEGSNTLQKAISVFSILASIGLLSFVYPVLFRYESLSSGISPSSQFQIAEQVSNSWTSWPEPAIKAIGLGYRLKLPSARLSKFVPRLNLSDSHKSASFVRAGDYFLYSGDKSNARSSYQKALELDPYNSPLTYYWLMSSFDHGPEREAARAIQKKILEIYDPTQLKRAHTLHRAKLSKELLPLFTNVADGLNPYQNPLEAEPFYKSALEIEFSARAAFGLGVCLWQQKRFQEAKPYLQEAHEANPAYPVTP